MIEILGHARESKRYLEELEGEPLSDFSLKDVYTSFLLDAYIEKYKLKFKDDADRDRRVSSIKSDIEIIVTDDLFPLADFLVLQTLFGSPTSVNNIQ